MFKPTPSLQKMLRRLPLSTKQAGKEYYKGNRVGNLGTITRYGNFAPDWSKIRTYVLPLDGLTQCELTPFVPENVAKTETARSGEYQPYAKKFTGADYLKAWKQGGGHDLVETEQVEPTSASRNMPEPFEERPAKK
ncbi:hypothetical protein DE146DRAFT_658376 [Phaeosphaeria sp. MPI-PUGE-AT-0046c]|nr:hypothetical protein DE146DRAFT_658376 [Phaeosphaeria sp. MPI-PUGE-AT-0046c]